MCRYKKKVPSALLMLQELYHYTNGYSSFIVPQMIVGLNLNFTVNYLGDGAEAYFGTLYDSGEPFIFYSWTPTRFIANRNFTRVAFPDFKADVYTSFYLDREHYPLTCDTPNDILYAFVSLDYPNAVRVRFKTYNLGLKEIAPDLLTLLRLFAIPDDDMQEVLKHMDTMNLEAYDVACNWVREHKSVWSTWIPVAPNLEIGNSLGFIFVITYISFSLSNRNKKIL